MPYQSANDTYRGQQPSASEFGRKAIPITESDTVDLNPYPKAIVCAAEGNLVAIPVENSDEVAVTFTSCPVGFIPPVQIRRVKTASTGTWVAIY